MCISFVILAQGHSEHDFEVHGDDDEIPFKCVEPRSII